MMKGKNISLFAEIGLVLILSIVFAGAAAANQKTLVVSSSEQRIDYGNQVFTYKGEVKATWEDIVLEADEMEVYLTEENTLKEIIARGNVKVIQREKNRQVNGESAIYVAEDDRLIMEGQVHYRDELGNDLKADKMTIWIKTEKIEAEGTPVKAIYVLEELEEE
jgi:lipopolysaccharide export system protein LptA